MNIRDPASRLQSGKYVEELSDGRAWAYRVVELRLACPTVCETT